MGTRQIYVEAIILFLSVLSLTKIKFPHLVKVQFLRPVTWTLAVIYFAAMTWLSIVFPNGPAILQAILLIVPIYIFGISFLHTWRVRRTIAL
jgi:phosphatidylcholine synthase